MSDPAPAVPAPALAAAPSKLMPALVGFNSLLLVGVLGFLGYSMLHKPAAGASSGDEHGDAAEAAPAPEKAEEHKKEGGGDHPPGVAAGPGPMVRLPDFVVHLRNPDIDRYARITFDVEVIADLDKDRLNANLPRVRDAFISYLSDRTVEELRGSEGLGRTKDALQLRLRELVPEARFRALYISDFVVQ